MSKKIIVCLILVFASVFSSTLPVFALGETEEELVKQTIPFSQTTVEQDFERLKEQPENNFNEENYPAINGGKPQLLTVVEDCNLPSSYDLYIYIYNPGLLDLNWCNQEFAQLSYTGVSYYKYPLTFIDDTEDHRFIKVKVNMPESHWKHLNKSKRDLYFSGFELSVVQNAKTKVIEYPAGSFLQQGVGKGDLAVKMTFEGNGQGKSKMTKAIGIDALQLDLNMTYYRTTNADSADGSLNQLVTCYFKIPERYFDNYGVISACHYSFDKYFDFPVFIGNFNPAAVFDWYYPKAFFDSEFSSAFLYDKKVGSSLTLAFAQDNSTDLKSIVENGKISNTLYTGSIWPGENNYFECFSKGTFPFVLLDPVSNLSSDKLEKIFSMSDYYVDDAKVQNIEKIVESGKIEDFISSDSYLASTNLWQRFVDFGLAGLFINTDDSFDIPPISLVKKDDVYLANNVFSQQYCIELEEVNTVKQALHSANNENCRLVLLRVDLTTYKTQDFDYVGLYSSSGWDVHPISFFTQNSNSRLVYTSNTVYKNVDVIDFTFQNDQGKYVIPVFADPVEIYVPPIVLPEDVVDKIFPVKPEVSYLGLIILIITTMVVVMLTPTLAPAIGRFFGSPIDKWAKKHRQRRRKK